MLINYSYTLKGSSLQIEITPFVFFKKIRELIF